MPTPTPTAARKVDPEQPAPRPDVRRRSHWLLELYRSALGKKYAMALSGLFIMAWLVGHVIGNLKMYLGPEEFNHYSIWLRQSLGYPLLPHTWTLWLIRILLLGAFVVHIHAAYALTVMNRRARPERYQSERDYVAANFAARTMRWTGVIVALFVIYHLADFTWGWVNPGGRYDNEAYGNLVQSFSIWPVSIFYIVANLALGYHLFHGAWSMFQSLGVNEPRYNHWRRWFAIGLAAFITIPNISFPIAVLAGIIHV